MPTVEQSETRIHVKHLCTVQTLFTQRGINSFLFILIKSLIKQNISPS